MAQAGSTPDGLQSQSQGTQGAQRTALVGSLETGASIALIVAVIGVFQGGSEIFYQLGMVLLVVGVVGTLGGLLLKRASWVAILERISVLGMFIGILGMLQPWNIIWYENGFYLLALMTLGFIIVSHIPAGDAG